MQCLLVKSLCPLSLSLSLCSQLLLLLITFISKVPFNAAAAELQLNCLLHCFLLLLFSIRLLCFARASACAFVLLCVLLYIDFSYTASITAHSAFDQAININAAAETEAEAAQWALAH